MADVDHGTNAGMSTEGLAALPNGERVTVPTAFAAFPDALNPPPPLSMVERAYNLVRHTTPHAGGHFPMVEVPQLFADDVLSFVNEQERQR